jgi:hypothetical protein
MFNDETGGKYSNRFAKMVNIFFPSFHTIFYQYISSACISSYFVSFKIASCPYGPCYRYLSSSILYLITHASAYDRGFSLYSSFLLLKITARVLEIHLSYLKVTQPRAIQVYMGLKPLRCVVMHYLIAI